MQGTSSTRNLLPLEIRGGPHKGGFGQFHSSKRREAGRKRMTAAIVGKTAIPTYQKRTESSIKRRRSCVSGRGEGSGAGPFKNPSLYRKKGASKYRRGEKKVAATGDKRRHLYGQNPRQREVRSTLFKEGGERRGTGERRQSEGRI